MPPTNTRTYGKRKVRATTDPDVDRPTPEAHLSPLGVASQWRPPKRQRKTSVVDAVSIVPANLPSTPLSSIPKPLRRKPQKKRIMHIGSEIQTKPLLRMSELSQPRLISKRYNRKENSHAGPHARTGSISHVTDAYTRVHTPVSHTALTPRVSLASPLRPKTPNPNLLPIHPTVMVDKQSQRNLVQPSAPAPRSMRPRPSKPLDSNRYSDHLSAHYSPKPASHWALKSRKATASQSSLPHQHFQPQSTASAILPTIAAADSVLSLSPSSPSSKSWAFYASGGGSVSGHTSQVHPPLQSSPHEIGTPSFDVSFVSTPKPAIYAPSPLGSFIHPVLPSLPEEESPSTSPMLRKERQRAQRISDSLFSTTMPANSTVPASVSHTSLRSADLVARNNISNRQDVDDMSLESCADPAESDLSSATDNAEGHTSLLHALTAAVSAEELKVLDRPVGSRPSLTMFDSLFSISREVPASTSSTSFLPRPSATLPARAVSFGATVTNEDEEAVRRSPLPSARAGVPRRPSLKSASVLNSVGPLRPRRPLSPFCAVPGRGNPALHPQAPNITPRPSQQVRHISLGSTLEVSQVSSAASSPSTRSSSPDPLDCIPRMGIPLSPPRRRGPTWSKFLNREMTPPGEKGDEFRLIPRPQVMFLAEEEFDAWVSRRMSRQTTDSSPVYVAVPKAYRRGILSSDL